MHRAARITPATFRTWLRFNAVGIAGAVVQLIVLSGLTRLGVHYLIATVIAVECALLHNFYWHVRWTWAHRTGTSQTPSLWRFHVANGFVSVVSNLALMRVFTGWLGMPVEIANLLAIVLTSFLNFFLGDRWVFRNRLPAARS